MALHVNEVAIQLQVADELGSPPVAARDHCCDIDKAEIVEDCVRRVLEELQAMRER